MVMAVVMMTGVTMVDTAMAVATEAATITSAAAVVTEDRDPEEAVADEETDGKVLADWL